MFVCLFSNEVLPSRKSLSLYSNGDANEVKKFDLQSGCIKHKSLSGSFLSMSSTAGHSESAILCNIYGKKFFSFGDFV